MGILTKVAEVRLRAVTRAIDTPANLMMLLLRDFVCDSFRANNRDVSLDTSMVLANLYGRTFAQIVKVAV